MSTCSSRKWSRWDASSTPEAMTRRFNERASRTNWWMTAAPSAESAFNATKERLNFTISTGNVASSSKPGRPGFDELATLPVDIVKLSRSFVALNADSADGAAVIHQLVRDARSLNLRVIASGVEDASQRDHLRDEQVDIGQGFHFAHPYEAHEIDRFLQDFALFSGRPL